MYATQIGGYVMAKVLATASPIVTVTVTVTVNEPELKYRNERLVDLHIEKNNLFINIDVKTIIDLLTIIRHIDIDMKKNN